MPAAMTKYLSTAEYLPSGSRSLSHPKKIFRRYWPVRFIAKELGVVVFHHTDAGTGGAHDDFIVAEGIDEMLCRLLRLIAVSRIHRRLPATSLRLAVQGIQPQPPKHPDGGLPDLGKEQIDNAGDKQRDFFHRAPDES